MSIHYLRGYFYGCYSVGKAGFERHQREIVGDFGAPLVFQSGLLDDVARNARKNHHISDICVGSVSTDSIQDRNEE